MKSKLFLLIALLIALNQNSFSQSVNLIDLNLNSVSLFPRTSNENIGSVRFILKNESLVNTATNIKVVINPHFSQPNSIFSSFSASKGTFEIKSNLWILPNLLPRDSAILVLEYKVFQGGPWYIDAEVFSVDQADSDSTPINWIETEDDFTKACFSNPIIVSETNFVGRQIIIEDNSFKNISWTKDGVIIPNQNSKSLNIFSVGSYNFQSPEFKCPTQGCCPFIFEAGIPDPNCCEPLEYILKNSNAETKSEVTKFELIGNDNNMEDADVASIKPNDNYGSSEFMDPYAWTQSGSLNIKRSFIKFDLSNLPKNITIDSAKLTLFFGQKLIDLIPVFTGHSGDNELEIERVLTDWSENSITWNNMPTVTSDNKLIVPKATSLKQDYILNITSLFKDILTTSNYGLRIKHSIETPFKITPFSTSESLDINLRPKLEIYYH